MEVFVDKKFKYLCHFVLVGLFFFHEQTQAKSDEKELTINTSINNFYKSKSLIFYYSTHSLNDKSLKTNFQNNISLMKESYTNRQSNTNLNEEKSLKSHNNSNSNNSNNSNNAVTYEEEKSLKVNNISNNNSSNNNSNNNSNKTFDGKSFSNLGQKMCTNNIRRSERSAEAPSGVNFTNFFTSSFRSQRSPKRKKTLMTWLSFCAFGICLLKSFA